MQLNLFINPLKMALLYNRDRIKGIKTRKIISSDVCLAILISALFLIIGDFFVIQRTMALGDAIAYVSMIEGNWNLVSSPFKFRILVPFIASVLPFPPLTSLKFVSYVSLFFSYLFLVLTCRKLDLKFKSIVMGLFCVWGSTFHLYNYHNPFLTDAFGLMMLSLMLFALVNGNYLLFMGSACIGVLGRETTIFLAPTWLTTKRWKQNLLLGVLLTVIYLIPRISLKSDSDPTFFATLKYHTTVILQEPYMFLRRVIATFGFIWIWSMIGLLYTPCNRFAVILAAYMCLLTGACFTSLIATDTGRMFSILTPVMVIACTLFFSEFSNDTKDTLILISVILLQPLLAIPNAILDSSFWHDRKITLPRMVYQCSAVLVIIYFLFSNKTSLKSELIRKKKYIRDRLRSTLSVN